MTAIGVAISYHDEVQHGTNNGPTAQAFAKNVPVGHTLIVAAQAPSTTAETTFTMTDSAGNTYTQRKVQAHATPINNQIVLFTCQVTAAITAGSTTWTLKSVNRNPAGWAVIAEEFDSLSDGYDSTAGTNGNQGASHDPATGATATAAQDLETIVVALGFIDTGSANVYTPPAGWSTTAKATTLLASPKSVLLTWRTVDAPGTRSFTGTGSLSVSANWAAAIMAMKADPDPSGMYIWNGSALVPVEVTIAT